MTLGEAVGPRGERLMEDPSLRAMMEGALMEVDAVAGHQSTCATRYVV